ncbi:TetR/AcrR family transcriptional regulator (plasmid) [Deinococcus sp. KNUC1210]|uniref:TetR family transcriptional regulator C-terminal domain-containing protein n=1 Tax=Deinococcus sp. KNUC1210 TaxID=2917691 RepID=UPI001EF0EA57|nr:TetR family transcriptional regulator C-terminal domain-containing protein [Deinococcus sp. KNUC1210]ULH17075.1 TetR/AcrR family transcriptional regulator [Deinococcus sp. KNUC1210]
MREQLLESGLETLHERGFNATAVQDITEAAGVPKGSFYNHFVSKEELGAAVVQRFVLTNQPIREMLSDETLAPLERLRAYFTALVETALQRQRYRGCLLGNFATELSGQSSLIRTEVDGALSQWTDAVATVIAEAQQAGQLTDPQPAADLAAFIINAWEGSVLRFKVQQDPAPLHLFLKTVLHKLLV